MVDVQTDHLRRTSRRTTGLDRPCIAVQAAQEAHQTGGLSAAGEPFTLRPNLGEVRTRTGAALEQLRLRHILLRDGVLAKQLIADGHDEASRSLCARIIVFCLDDLPLQLIPIVVARTGAGDAVSTLQAGIKPLRRVWCIELGQETVDQLVVENLALLALIDQLFFHK